MIQSAYLLLAMEQVRLKGKETNQTTYGYFAESISFCDLVFSNGNNETSALYAGLPLCTDYIDVGQSIYDNMVSSELVDKDCIEGRQ